MPMVNDSIRIFLSWYCQFQNYLHFEVEWDRSSCSDSFTREREHFTLIWRALYWCEHFELINCIAGIAANLCPTMNSYFIALFYWRHPITRLTTLKCLSFLTEILYQKPLFNEGLRSIPKRWSFSQRELSGNSEWFSRQKVALKWGYSWHSFVISLDRQQSIFYPTHVCFPRR